MRVILVHHHDYKQLRLLHKNDIVHCAIDAECEKKLYCLAHHQIQNKLNIDYLPFLSIKDFDAIA